RVPGGSGSGLLAFAVPPTASGFDREAIRLVRLLVPHLQIAARTHLHVLNLTRQRSRILEALDLLNRPVLFVDATARVRLANRSAEHLLREADALSGGGCSGLEAATSGQTTALRHLIARAAGMAGEPATGGSLS